MNIEERPSVVTTLGESEMETRFKARILEINNTKEDSKEIVQAYADEKDAPLSNSLPYKQQKYIALYRARKILSIVGTVGERMQSAKLLKIMVKKGLESL